MEFNWPEVKTAKANEIKTHLKHLCIDMNDLNTDQIVRAFNEILLDFDNRKHYDTLSNADRKEEFGKLVRIVKSIYWYFHSPEFVYKIRPQVFKANMKFFSYEGH
jgi:hypothetical protein